MAKLMSARRLRAVLSRSSMQVLRQYRIGQRKPNPVANARITLFTHSMTRS